MLLTTFTSADLWRVALSVFLVASGLALAWAFLALAGTLKGLTAFLKGTQDEVLPMIHELGGTVQRMNVQLDKLDKVTDSAVDAADAADGAVRAVSHVITTPIRKVSSVAAGLKYGGAALRKSRSWNEAVRAGKDAAARKRHDVDEDLGKPRGPRE